MRGLSLSIRLAPISETRKAIRIVPFVACLRPSLRWRLAVALQFWP